MDKKVIINQVGKPGKSLSSEEDFNNEVNKRLPKKIQQFFFFDGEQLDTYLVGNTGENVEQTVLEISQIDLLVTMQRNLETISSDLRKDLSKTTPKTAEINRQLEEKIEELKNNEKEYLSRKAELERAKIELQNIKNELGNDPDIAELEDERSTLNLHHEETQQLLDDNSRQIKDTLREYVLYLSALPKIRSMYDVIVEKESKNELPPKYDKNELLKMLSNHHCAICDRDLDGKSMVHLENLIKRFELSSETGTLLTRIKGSLEMIINQTKNYPQVRDSLFSTKRMLEVDLTKIESRISEIDSICDKYTNKNEIIKRYKKRAVLEQYVPELERATILAEIDRDTSKKEKEELEEKLQKALNDNKIHSQLRKEKELADKAFNRVSDIIKRIKGDIRNQISGEMCHKFFNLMWKKKFKTVELTENYTASVINNDNLECLGSCSAAERELLVLAFTLALHKQSGFDGPLVIDTPISRISGTLRVNFAEVLRKVSEDKQIILFMTDDEFSTNVRDVFELSANNKYKLKLENEDFVVMEDLKC